MVKKLSKTQKVALGGVLTVLLGGTVYGLRHKFKTFDLTVPVNQPDTPFEPARNPEEFRRRYGFGPSKLSQAEFNQNRKLMSTSGSNARVEFGINAASIARRAQAQAPLQKSSP